MNLEQKIAALADTNGNTVVDQETLERLLKAYDIVKEYGRAVQNVCEAEAFTPQPRSCATAPQLEILKTAQDRVSAAEDALNEFAVTIGDL